MWLLDGETGTLVDYEFTGDNIPPYAILSHIWAAKRVRFNRCEIQFPGLGTARRRSVSAASRLFGMAMNTYGYE